MDETDTDGEESEPTAAESAIDERVTAPMQSFGSREVSIGVVVLAVGLLVTFLLPLAF